jgi:hypothetical protein
MVARRLTSWGGLLRVRDGIWLACRRGVAAEVCEPSPLPIRPFENAQIAEYLLFQPLNLCLGTNTDHLILRASPGQGGLSVVACSEAMSGRARLDPRLLHSPGQESGRGVVPGG